MKSEINKQKSESFGTFGFQPIKAFSFDIFELILILMIGKTKINSRGDF